MLGLLYLADGFVKKNSNKGFYYLYLAANQNIPRAQFIIGAIYFKGKIIKRDIKSAIHYYKEASNNNNSHAKNNLAMIYKNEVNPNFSLIIEYLQEAVKLDNVVSMYNLAHLYFFENICKNNYKKIIDLLIKPSCFYNAPLILLTMVLVKKLEKDITLEKIKKELNSYNFINQEFITQLVTMIYNIIKIANLENKISYDMQYQILKPINYVYDYNFQVFPLSYILNGNKSSKNITRINIDQNFYEGFGL